MAQTPNFGLKKLSIAPRETYVEPKKNLFNNLTPDSIDMIRSKSVHIKQAFVQSGEAVPNLKAYLALSQEFEKRGL